MNRIPALIAFLVPLLSVAASATPLDDLLDKGDGGACFTRTYDSAHLKRVPGQDTRSVVMSLIADEPDTAEVRIVLRGLLRTSVIAGWCAWADRANMDTMNEPMLETFKARSGLDCNAMTSTDGMSAEEGGYFAIDLRDGNSVHLHLPDAIAAWPSLDRAYTSDFLEFGADDRVFRVDYAKRDQCAEIDTRISFDAQ